MKHNEFNADRHISVGHVHIRSSSDSACDLHCPKPKGRQMSKKLFPVVVVVAATIAGCAPTGPVFSIQDRAGLGAFLAFEVVGNAGGAAPPAPDGAPAGDWCDECTPGGSPLYPSHPGKVGDGTVFNTCPECGGTQKAPGMSRSEEIRKAGENSPRAEEEMKQFSEAIDNVTEDWNESTVRDLGDKLADVLEAQEEAKDITCIDGPSWTIEEKRSRNASDADIREHLVTVHGIDPDSANKMDREELLSLHNLLHNTEIRSSAPTADCPSGTCPASRGSSSCPSGNCPASRGSSSSSRRGLFGWRR